MTGGGSGGHITPILAVAKELKAQRPDTRIVYIGDSRDGLDDVVAADPNIDEMHSVRAGKLRRYHGEGFRQLLDIPTMVANLRDGLLVVAGLWQSFWLLRRVRPSIIFTRGSYVSVPVTLAGALLHIPYVTHDSDAIPSLTNRLIARWATLHAVALPEELYHYPIDKTVTVGVPISPEYQRVSTELQARYRSELGLPGSAPILLITGGGLGAQSLNEAVVANARELLSRYEALIIIHLTGRSHEESIKKAYADMLSSAQLKRVMVRGFVTDMYRYTGSANLVIARGGATNLAELAVQAKPCIIVPNALLTGGHQVKNTAALADKQAVVIMTAEQVEQELRLASVVSDLFDHPRRLAELSRAIYDFARPDAAHQLATLLYDKARQTHTDESGV